MMINGKKQEITIACYLIQRTDDTFSVADDATGRKPDETRRVAKGSDFR